MFHTVLTSPLDEDEWSASRSSRVVPREKPPVYILWEAGSLQSPSLRAGQEKKSFPCQD
jgi:hypothetical protein